MSEKEPVALGNSGMLRMQAFDQSNEGAGTCVGSQDRGSIFATKWVIGAVLDRPSEEAAMEIKDG